MAGPLDDLFQQARAWFRCLTEDSVEVRYLVGQRSTVGADGQMTHHGPHVMSLEQQLPDASVLLLEHLIAHRAFRRYSASHGSSFSLAFAWRDRIVVGATPSISAASVEL
jgi:hypothetical protein